MTKPITYTQKDLLIVSILKNAPDGLTLKEMNEAAPEGEIIRSGNLTSAVKKGLIEVIGDRETVRTGKRNITFYGLVSADLQSDADGKPFNYTDNEKAILAAVAAMPNKDRFTLEDLAAAMGKEKLFSGNINALVTKKGNIAKVATEQVAVQVKGGSVNVYGFKADPVTE